MEVLDKFCRFCTSELDPSQRKNIFETENSHLLKAALECISLPMSAEDRYPNFSCGPCAYKLNAIVEFQSNGLSAVHFFDEYLASNEINSTAPVEDRLTTQFKIEILEEAEADIVEEFLTRIESKSENGDNQECGYDFEDPVSAPEQLKKCTVKISRCDDEGASSETQGIAETGDLLEALEGATKERFYCNRCTKNFKTRSSLVKHRFVHTGERSTQEQESHLVVHSRVHKAEKPFKCQQCEKSFCHKSTLVIHTRSHLAEKPFKCQYCERGFIRKTRLNAHILTHMVGNPLNLASTKQGITVPGNLKATFEATGAEPHCCDFCGNCYKYKTSLMKHRRKHTGETPIKCQDCGKCFRFKSDMVAHARIHKGEKSFICERCGKCFSRKTGLVKHLRIHTGEKPYQCQHCQKSFKSKSDLVRHSSVHTGEKPYKCEQCEKTFREKTGLVTHLRGHAGLKPFKCERCKKSFSHRSALVYHTRVHTGENPYECEHCEKTFRVKQSLTIHNRIHTEKKTITM